MSADKINAIVTTVVFHALLLVVLLFSFLKFPPSEPREWPPADTSEILFDTFEEPDDVGMKLLRGDTPDPAAADAAPSDIAEPSEISESSEHSEHSEFSEHSETSESLVPSEITEAKRQEQARKNVDDKMKNRFSGNGQGSGKTGAPEGNDPAAGALSGAPGNGVSGRTLEHWTSVKSAKTGEIAVRVKVGPDGRVVQASYDPSRSSGSVAADVAMRDRCVQASRQCRFSVIEGSALQSGTITWRFH